MEKVVVFPLIILSFGTIYCGNDPSPGLQVSPAPEASVTVKPTNVQPTITNAPGPTSGAVSFTASAGLVVSLVMALLH